jgi:hypothetical protein
MWVKLRTPLFTAQNKNLALGGDAIFFRPDHSRRVSRLERATAREKLNQANDDRYHQQEVDEPAANVDDNAQKPKNDEHDGDCPEHDGLHQ